MEATTILTRGDAAGAALGQMLDSHSHGAGNSPEFQARWKRLEEATRRQREAMRAEGHSTDEFDENLRASVSRYLRDRGLSKAEIEAKLAVSASPLDAVKPYLRTDKDAQELTMATNNSVAQLLATDQVAVATAVSAEPSKAAPGAKSTPSLDEVMAKFKASGVAPAGKAVEQLAGHGLAPYTMKIRQTAESAQLN